MVTSVRQTQLQQKFTYGDYTKAPKGERWEIVNGNAIMMSAPTWQHQSILRELTTELTLFFRGKPCRPFMAPFDLCIADENEEDDDITTVLQPDLVVVCDETKLRKTGYFGVPVFVAEILSPSTAKRDIFTKFEVYERVGVKEYWQIQPDEKFVAVFTMQDNQMYGRPMYYDDNKTILSVAFPELSVDLKQVFAGV